MPTQTALPNTLIERRYTHAHLYYEKGSDPFRLELRNETIRSDRLTSAGGIGILGNIELGEPLMAAAPT